MRITQGLTKPSAHLQTDRLNGEAVSHPAEMITLKNSYFHIEGVCPETDQRYEA